MSDNPQHSGIFGSPFALASQKTSSSSGHRSSASTATTSTHPSVQTTTTKSEITLAGASSLSTLSPFAQFSHQPEDVFEDIEADLEQPVVLEDEIQELIENEVSTDVHLSEEQHHLGAHHSGEQHHSREHHLVPHYVYNPHDRLPTVIEGVLQADIPCSPSLQSHYQQQQQQHPPSAQSTSYTTAPAPTTTQSRNDHVFMGSQLQAAALAALQKEPSFLSSKHQLEHHHHIAPAPMYSALPNTHAPTVAAALAASTTSKNQLPSNNTHELPSLALPPPPPPPPLIPLQTQTPISPPHTPTTSTLYTTASNRSSFDALSPQSVSRETPGSSQKSSFESIRGGMDSVAAPSLPSSSSLLKQYIGGWQQQQQQQHRQKRQSMQNAPASPSPSDNNTSNNNSNNNNNRRNEGILNTQLKRNNSKTAFNFTPRQSVDTLSTQLSLDQSVIFGGGEGHRNSSGSSSRGMVMVGKGHHGMYHAVRAMAKRNHHHGQGQYQDQYHDQYRQQYALDVLPMLDTLKSVSPTPSSVSEKDRKNKIDSMSLSHVTLSPGIFQIIEDLQKSAQKYPTKIHAFVSAGGSFVPCQGPSTFSYQGGTLRLLKIPQGCSFDELLATLLAADKTIQTHRHIKTTTAVTAVTAMHDHRQRIPSSHQYQDTHGSDITTADVEQERQQSHQRHTSSEHDFSHSTIKTSVPVPPPVPVPMKIHLSDAFLATAAHLIARSHTGYNHLDSRYRIGDDMLHSGTFHGVPRYCVVRYQLPSNPDLMVDVLEDDDVELLFEEYAVYQQCCDHQYRGKKGHHASRLHIYIEWNAPTFDTYHVSEGCLSGNSSSYSSNGEEEEERKGRKYTHTPPSTSGISGDVGATHTTSNTHTTTSNTTAALVSAMTTRTTTISGDIQEDQQNDTTPIINTNTPATPTSSIQSDQLETVPAKYSTNSTTLSIRSDQLEIVPAQDVVLYELMGSGLYGDMYKGRWKECDVGVKCLNPIAIGLQYTSRTAWLSFLDDVNEMGAVRHPHLVALYGIVLPGSEQKERKNAEHEYNSASEYQLSTPTYADIRMNNDTTTTTATNDGSNRGYNNNTTNDGSRGCCERKKNSSLVDSTINSATKTKNNLLITNEKERRSFMGNRRKSWNFTVSGDDHCHGEKQAEAEIENYVATTCQKEEKVPTSIPPLKSLQPYPTTIVPHGVQQLPGHVACPPALIMEYVPGRSLHEAIKRKEKIISSMLARIIIALDVCRAMHYLHRVKGLVHFHLKSGNVLLGWRERRPLAKVAEYGLAMRKRSLSFPCIALASAHSRHTLPWNAPELIRNPENVSHKIDVYSFGIICWELWSLSAPYADVEYASLVSKLINTDEIVRPRIPLEKEEPAKGWRFMMERCWSEDPDERPEFSELIDILHSMAKSTQEKKKIEGKIAC